jgi:Ino eighty subunit 2
MDTINRLLQKQAPKKRGRKAIEGEEYDEDGMPIPPVEKPPIAFVRYVQNVDGGRLGVPQEWLEAPVGEIFTGGVRTATLVVGGDGRGWSGRLVEEVE